MDIAASVHEVQRMPLVQVLQPLGQPIVVIKIIFKGTEVLTRALIQEKAEVLASLAG